jgi:hypothetical protein
VVPRFILAIDGVRYEGEGFAGEGSAGEAELVGLAPLHPTLDNNILSITINAIYFIVFSSELPTP